MTHHPQTDQPKNQDHQQPEPKPHVQIREHFDQFIRTHQAFLNDIDNQIDLQTHENFSALQNAAKRSRYELITQNVGTVKQVGDGVAIVSGLQGVMENELVLFPDSTYGLAMDLHEFHVGCVILGSSDQIQAGDIVY
jgi:hypothetical protein